MINLVCPGKKKRFLTNVAGKIAKLAGGACGRRWLHRLRSQTQSLTAQEATFEGRGEREEISLRQCVLRDHQIRSGSGLFIHSASTHHYTNRSVGQAPRLHRRIWQRRRCLHSDNVDANLKNCSGISRTRADGAHNANGVDRQERQGLCASRHCQCTGTLRSGALTRAGM